MIEILLMLLLLLLVGVFGVVLGVHLQAAKSKTDCGCGGRKRGSDLLAQRVRKLELIQWQIEKDKQADASGLHLQHGDK